MEVLKKLPAGFIPVEDEEPTVLKELPEGFEPDLPELKPVKPIEVDNLWGQTDIKSTSKVPDTYVEDIKASTSPSQKKEYETYMETKGKAGEVRSDVENIYNKYSTMVSTAKGLWNPEDRDKAIADMDSVKQEVVDELSSQGFKNPMFVDGELTIDINGAQTPIDNSILSDIWNSKMEATVAAGGAIAGGILTPGGPLLKAAGAIAGGMAGASVGRGLDILWNKVNLVNEVEDKVIYDQMVEAGIADAFMGVLGTAAFKSMAGAGRYMKRTYDFIADGNKEGALKHAKAHFGVSDSEAEDIVNQVESLVGEIPGTKEQKTIQALVQSRRGGEGVIESANIFHPSAGANMAKQIFKRAEEVSKASKEISADNVTRVIRDNLDKYTKEVKGYYKTVKESTKEFTKDYLFNYEKLGIDPIVESIGQNIENPTVKQRYLNLLTKIQDASEGRTFNDLIDLRQAVNEIKFATKNIKRRDQLSLDKVLNSIDGEISRVADTHIPDSKTWKNAWDTSKREYSKMKKMEKNILHKVLTRPGINEDTVVRMLSKYATAEDNTFFEVLDKLPKNVRNRVDGAVLNNMVEKYSAGEVGGSRAIHFPLLSQELNKVKWTSPKAKQQVRTINRMADVFKNDVNLAKVSGRLMVPKFQSYLTTDPVVRAKYELASSVFNYVKMLIPGDQADSIALARNVGKLLDNPLDQKSYKDMFRAMPKERRTFRERLDFDPQLNNLRQLYMDRKQALKALYNRDDIPHRLVWKKPLEAPTKAIPSDEVLFATDGGVISRDPTSAIMNQQSADLISDFIWQNTKNGTKLDITDQAFKYMESSRFENILNSVKNKMTIDDRNSNIEILSNIVKKEADILTNRIQKDFGVVMSVEDANKIIKLKLNELVKECQ